MQFLSGRATPYAVICQGRSLRFCGPSWDLLRHARACKVPHGVRGMPLSRVNRSSESSLLTDAGQRELMTQVLATGEMALNQAELGGRAPTLRRWTAQVSDDPAIAERARRVGPSLRANGISPAVDAEPLGRRCTAMKWLRYARRGRCSRICTMARPMTPRMPISALVCRAVRMVPAGSRSRRSLSVAEDQGCCGRQLLERPACRATASIAPASQGGYFAYRPPRQQGRHLDSREPDR